MTSIIFVCWGNICRSPMAERVARAHVTDAGLPDVQITSAATTTEEVGSPMDRRAAATLRQHGYDPDGHVAHQISRQELAAADLVIPMEQIHLRQLHRIADGDAMDHVRLLLSFDPDSSQTEVPDPWYGGMDGFEDTLTAIENSMPGLIAYLQQKDSNSPVSD